MTFSPTGLNLLIVGFGVVLFAMSAFADAVGLGGYPGFGKKQLMGSMLGVLCVCVGILRLMHHATPRFKSRVKENGNLIFICISMLLALLVRFSLLDFESGDYRNNLSHWYDFIRVHGGFKALGHNFSNYTPPYLYFMTLVTFLPIPKLYAIKLISILFDFFAATVTYFIVDLRYKGKVLPLLSFVCILFAPTVFFNSSLWGQCDIIYTTGLLLSIYFLLKRKTLAAMILYSLAFSFKFQSVFLLPLLLILCLKEEIPFKYLLLIPIIFGLAISPCILLGRPWVELFLIYPNQTTTYSVLTANAPNLYQWLPNQYFPLLGKAGIFFAIMIVLTFCFIAYRGNVRMGEETIIKISLISVLIIPFSVPQMHERFFFPADVISIIYAFYFPKYFYLPFLVGFSSFFSYLPFLFGNSPFPLIFLPIPILITIILSTMDLTRSLYASVH